MAIASSRRRAGSTLVSLAAATLLLLLPQGERPSHVSRAALPSHRVPADTTRADPASLAAALLQGCGAKPYTEKADCLQAGLTFLVESVGLPASLATLIRLADLDPDARREGHAYAHAIGMSAYEAGADVAETFRQCADIFQYGCHHGVIQAYFQSARKGNAGGRGGSGGSDVDSAAVAAVCRSFESDADRWLLFTCVHGVGHGLTLFYGHDLLRALRGCDLLPDAWHREACYSGAFMENIVNAITPHVSRHAVHAHATGWPAFKPLDPEDLHYPCSIVEPRYLSACYALQTSAVLAQTGEDMRAAARICDESPRAVRPVCYQSLGRDVSARALQDPAEAVRLCRLGNPRYRPWCHAGVAKDIAYGRGNLDRGFAFCRRVPGVESQLKCHEALGEQIGTFAGRREEGEALCGRSEKAFLEACRYGARLTLEPAPGLPLAPREPDAAAGSGPGAAGPRRHPENPLTRKGLGP